MESASEQALREIVEDRKLSGNPIQDGVLSRARSIISKGFPAMFAIEQAELPQEVELECEE